MVAPDVYECESCGERRLADTPPACCGDQMDAVEVAVPHDAPDLVDVGRNVFGIGATEREVCHQVMSDEEVTVEEVADRVDRDRSVVSRHLNHLVEIGIVEKEARALPEGGQVNVYSPVPEDRLRRRLQRGVYAWAREAVVEVDALTDRKLDARADSPTDDGPNESDARSTGEAASDASTTKSILNRVLGRDGRS